MGESHQHVERFGGGAAEDAGEDRRPRFRATDLHGERTHRERSGDDEHLVEPGPRCVRETAPRDGEDGQRAEADERPACNERPA